MPEMALLLNFCHASFKGTNKKPPQKKQYCSYLQLPYSYLWTLLHFESHQFQMLAFLGILLKHSYSGKYWVLTANFTSAGEEKPLAQLLLQLFYYLYFRWDMFNFLKMVLYIENSCELKNIYYQINKICPKIKNRNYSCPIYYSYPKNKYTYPKTSRPIDT